MMRLSRELTLNQALRAIGEAGFDMKFRILWGHKKWAIVLVHQQGEKSAHNAEYVAFSEEQLLRVIAYLGDRLRGGLTPLAEDAQDCIDWARHYLAEQYDGSGADA